MQLISFSQWNTALITALFLRPDRARTTLSRIDATGRVLEELSGGQDRTTAKRNFIKAFGCDPGAIKKHFTQTPGIAVLTRQDGIPPNFSALYLSLLAATADDDTFHVGNFRKRFAAMLEMDELEGFNFEDLPALWRQFALWSKNRAASVGDCAVLVLPDPQHEKLIGHAKRLAFPTYRDELQLRNALADFAVDSRDPFHAVSRAVYERLGKFSQTFKDELSGFRSLVSAERLQEAYDSPFWGAVRDITREEEEKELEQVGRLCVQVDTADPLFPELSILVDERASDTFGKGQSVRLPRPRGPYVAVWAGSSLIASISSLVSMAERDKAFSRSRLGVGLKFGCLPFFLDELGGLSSDGRYFDNGPCCLLMRSGNVQRIKSLASHAGLQCTEMKTEETSGQWTFLSFSAVSKLFMERLASEVPDGTLKLFSQGWAPALPRIAGAARYGQAVLLTPASNPYVRLVGATEGQYAILDASGLGLAAGALSASDDGFYIPPIQLVGLEGYSVCHFTLQMAGSDSDHVLDVPVVDRVPGGPLKTPENRHGWLIDGRLGVRESVANSFLPTGAVSARAGARLVHVGGSLPLFARSSVNGQACTHATLNTIYPALNWLSEAITLRFQTRGTLPFDELQAHLRMAGEAAGIDSWRLRRALIVGGWLQRIESPLSAHATIVAGPRTISWNRQGGRVMVRIRGMLTMQERVALTNGLASCDGIHRISNPSMPLSIGCIEMNVSSEEKALEIASTLRLRKLVQSEAAQDVLGGLFLKSTKANEVAAPEPSSAVLLWDTATLQWIPEKHSRDQLPLGSILRSEGRQRHTYYVRVNTGYRRTDSRCWAMLIKASCTAEGIGTVFQNGDVDWAGSLWSLPDALSSWWMHFGGGIVGIRSSGNYAFSGGRGISPWSGVANAGQNISCQQDHCAVERRTLALSILKGKRMRRGS